MFIFTYFVWRIVFNIVGYLYPAYASFKAIKANDTERLAEWLKYWVVLALFKVGEGIAGSFIFWLPFYYELLIVFVIWLVHPRTQGALVVYCSIAEPFLTMHEDKFEDVLALVHVFANNDFENMSTWRFLGVFLRAARDAEENAPVSEPIRPEDGARASYATYLFGRAASWFFPASPPAQSPPTGQGVTIYNAIPVDLQSASVSDQKAYLQQKRKQLERKMRKIDQVHKEITEREALPASSRLSPEQNVSRRRTKKGSGSSSTPRSSAVNSEQDELDGEFERVERDNSTDAMLDEEELRRQQTRDVGIMNYIRGYFAETSGI